ncbi:MAG TPA: hypothetical protein VGI52_09100 [Solirubrobacteraceae bacterium]|jgi:hypothetical protein
MSLFNWRMRQLRQVACDLSSRAYMYALAIGACADRTATAVYRSYFSSLQWIDGNFDASGGAGGSRLPADECSTQRIR